MKKPKSYLVTMTINKCKDYLKSWSYRKILVKEAFSIEKTKNVKDLIVHQEEVSLIGEAVLGLPLKYREPIILYYYEELSVKEIAVILKIPVNTIKTRMRKARELLKNKLHTETQWEVLLDET